MSRNPELWPSPMDGLKVPDARGSRLWVDPEGAVLFSRRGAEPKVLAAAGSISRITWLREVGVHKWRITPTPERGLLTLWSASTPQVTLNLQEVGVPGNWVRDQLAGNDQASFLHSSGLDAVAEALGLVVEAPTAAEARSMRWSPRVLSLGTNPRWPGWLRAALAIAGVVLAYQMLVAAEGGAIGWVAPVSFVVLAAMVWAFASTRRELLRILKSDPPHGDRVVITQDPPSELATVANRGGQIEVGRSEMVMRGAGSEWWVPGPERGGVTRAVLDGEDGLWLNQGKHPVAVLRASQFGANLEDLLTALADVGIVVERTPLGVTLPAHFAIPEIGPGEPLIWSRSDAGTANLVAAWIPPLALGLALPGFIATTALTPLLGGPLLVGWVALMVLYVRALRGFGKWERRQSQIDVKNN